jgi:hypothetical protein
MRTEHSGALRAPNDCLSAEVWETELFVDDALNFFSAHSASSV